VAVEGMTRLGPKRALTNGSFTSRNRARIRSTVSHVTQEFARLVPR